MLSQSGAGIFAARPIISSFVLGEFSVKEKLRKNGLYIDQAAFSNFALCYKIFKRDQLFIDMQSVDGYSTV